MNIERKHYVWIAFSLIFITGIILRLFNLDFQCLSWDEEFTQHIATNTVSYIIAFTFTRDPNPPLFYIIVHYLIQAFGNTVWIIRLPSAVFGILTIPFAYLLGKEYYNDILGIAFAFYIAVTYNFIFYSQFARAYMMVILMFMIFSLAYAQVANLVASMLPIRLAIALSSRALVTRVVGWDSIQPWGPRTNLRWKVLSQWAQQTLTV
jgi:uncharacterized membrane protein